MFMPTHRMTARMPFSLGEALMSQRNVWQRAGLLGVFVCSVSTAGCFHFFYRGEAKTVSRPSVAGPPTLVRANVRAHLASGATAVFRDSAWISRDTIRGGRADYFPLLSAASSPIGWVHMDSVVALESIASKLDGATTTVVSLAATAITPFAVAGLAVAIFGSCPTVYADTGAGLALQAEGFSYAIAPFFENRDLDPLRARPDSHGVIRLELRNEALETHFINHIGLLAVRHAPGARVVPDQGGTPVAVAALGTVHRAVDRHGRDVRRLLAAADGDLYQTSPDVLQRAHAGDLDDWIDLEVGNLPPGDSVGVVLRLRNSLLNTILLYEGMLGGRDAAEWLDRGLKDLGTAATLGVWYRNTMGMRATVQGVLTPGGDERGHVARIGDVGPIAFRDVALVLPRAAHNATTARIRLRFVADNWRIDALQVAGSVSRPSFTQLPVADIEVPTPAVGQHSLRDSAGLHAISAPDKAYLETRPGQRMTLVFAPDRSPGADSVSTYLLEWQGWYREWIRGSWLRDPARREAFVPGDAAVETALERWRTRKESFERQFYASKVPVR